MNRTGRAARVASLCLFVGWAVAASASGAAAQQPASPPGQQEPGAGAQVHTGTSSGITLETRIRNLLADHEYLQLAGQLDQLPPEQAQLYRGLLANRDNDAAKSIRLLEPLADKLAASGDKDDEKLLRKALAEDYLREGDWPKAATAYATLDTRLGPALTADEHDAIEMPVKMLPLAAANPPMTVDPCMPFGMQVDRDPLGLTDIPVFVDAQPHRWMLDPTAPFNLIARSSAREVGLKLSEQSATIHTLTGKSMQVWATVIPRFTIGGRLTLHNVTAFVYDDADYYFPQTAYQVQGVLGYAALQALGSVKFTAHATIEVDPGTQADPPVTTAEQASTSAGEAISGAKNGVAPTGARFFLDSDQVIVALGPPGNERMFVVDAAGQQSYLSSRYYAEHAEAFTGKPGLTFTIPTDSSIPPQPAYLAETVPLVVGGTLVRAHYLDVLTQPLGSAALDDVYGVLGIDVLDQLQSYTFDYRTMRFSVTTE